MALRKFSNDDIIPYQSFTVEREENLEDNQILYLIEPNVEYYIVREYYQDMIFFSIAVFRKLYGKIEMWGKKNIRFADCDEKDVDLPTGSIIKIKKASERWYFDRKRFNISMFYFLIFDYEVVKKGDRNLDIIRGLSSYRNLYEEDEMPNDILNSLGDIELPF